jgi:hypothetical protein
MRSLNPDLNGAITDQHLNSVEIFGRFNLNRRFQFSAFLPVNVIRQSSRDDNQRAAGLGDISLLAQYSVLNPLRCNGKKTKHQLRLGFGTKLPSGEFKMDANDLFRTNLQLGTGSIDFLFNAIYTFRYGNFGINTIAAYKLNTINNRGYRFGDKAQAGSSFFHLFTVQEVQLMPSVAFSYEHQFQNKEKGDVLNFTGGDFLTTSVGFDVYYKQFAFSSSVSPAVINHLNWSGENKNRFNVEVGVFYNFSTSK